MTTEQTEQTPLRPFHETIVGAISRATYSTEAYNLGELILQTRITAGLEKIIEVWKQKAITANSWISASVLAHLFNQLQATREASVELVDSFHYDGKERALMIVIEKIILIIQNWRQPNLQAIGKVGQIYKLFEIAKRIHRASDEAEFKLAITKL